MLDGLTILPPSRVVWGVEMLQVAFAGLLATLKEFPCEPAPSFRRSVN